jgi:hypothetical protein
MAGPPTVAVALPFVLAFIVVPASADIDPLAGQWRGL